MANKVKVVDVDAVGLYCTQNAKNQRTPRTTMGHCMDIACPIMTQCTAFQTQDRALTKAVKSGQIKLKEVEPVFDWDAIELQNQDEFDTHLNRLAIQEAEIAALEYEAEAAVRRAETAKVIPLTRNYGRYCPPNPKPVEKEGTPHPRSVRPTKVLWKLERNECFRR